MTTGKRQAKKRRERRIADLGLRTAIKAVGGSYRLAKLLGMSKQAFLEWKRVPAGRIRQVEDVTGVDREVLRPDLYAPR